MKKYSVTYEFDTLAELLDHENVINGFKSESHQELSETPETEAEYCPVCQNTADTCICNKPNQQTEPTQNLVPVEPEPLAHVFFTCPECNVKNYLASSVWVDKVGTTVMNYRCTSCKNAVDSRVEVEK